MAVELGISVIDAGSAGVFQQIEAAQDSLNESARKGAERYKYLNLSVKKLYQETRTPAERHNQRLKELDRLLQKGKIDQDLYTRSVKRSEEKMKMADKAARGMANSSQKIHGSESLTALKSLASGWLSVGAAIGIASKALSDINQKRAEAAQKAIESRMGVGSLAQVATSKKDFLTLRSQAEEVYKKGGAENLDQAARIIFQLRSAGLDDPKSRKLFTEMRATALMPETEELAVSVKSLVSAMGKDEAGSTSNIISKALGASGGSPTKATALLTAAAKGGAKASHLGFSDEQVLAATATLANVSGSAPEAGTQIESLMSSLFEKGKEIASTTGGGKITSIMDAVQRIHKMNLDDAELRKLLGRKEATDAFLLLRKNAAEYGKSFLTVHHAQKTDLVNQRLGFFKADPSLRAARMSEESRANEELSRTRLGTARNIADSMQRDREADWRKRGMPEWEIWVDQKAEGAGRFIWGDEYYLRRNQKSATPQQREAIEQHNIPDPSFLEKLHDIFSVSNVVAEKMSDSADKMQQAAETQLEAASQTQHAPPINPAVSHGDRR